jgi:hypothetical protein
MNAKEIAKIKRDGAERALKDLIQSKLWSARCSCERASCEQFKSYRKEVAAIRQLLDECDRLFNELDALST